MGYIYQTSVVGVTYCNRTDGASRQKNISRATESSQVDLIREQNNKFDKNAIAVYLDGQQVGYINKSLASKLSKRMDAGEVFDAEIVCIKGGPKYNLNYGVDIKIVSQYEFLGSQQVAPRAFFDYVDGC